MTKKSKNSVKNIAKRGALFPPNLAFTLLIPLRNIFLSPKKLIQRLQLKPDHQVLEVGPGPGYFSLPVARALPQGKLILADVQRDMLAKAEKRLSKRKITNVEYHHCNGVDFPFPANSFHRIFLVTVLGEVENKEQYAREFHRLLRPGGILSISEQAGDADQMTAAEIITLFEKHGLRKLRVYGTKRNYTVNLVNEKECRP